MNYTTKADLLVLLEEQQRELKEISDHLVLIHNNIQTLATVINGIVEPIIDEANSTKVHRELHREAIESGGQEDIALGDQEDLFDRKQIVGGVRTEQLAGVITAPGSVSGGAGAFKNYSAIDPRNPYNLWTKK